MEADYNDLVDFIVTNGDVVAPRGKTTYEVRGITLTMPHNLFISRAGMSNRLLGVETQMLLGGFFDIDLIKTAAPKADTKLFEKQSNYGPRIISQFSEALDILKKDSHSRRSMLYLNDRGQLRDDIACTTSIQFMIRKGFLETYISMRSWDVCYGLPADIFMFGNLAECAAKYLDVKVGPMSIFASSLHLYESTRDKAEQEYLAKWTQIEQGMHCRTVAARLAESLMPFSSVWSLYDKGTEDKPIIIGGI